VILYTEGSRDTDPPALYKAAGTEVYCADQPHDYAPARPNETELHMIAYGTDDEGERIWVYLYFDKVKDLRPGSCTLGACRK